MKPQMALLSLFTVFVTLLAKAEYVSCS